MKTTNDIYDIRIGFSFLDSEYLRRVGWDNLGAYVLLRRYIWRKETGKLGEYFKKNFLVANITQEHLADKLGVSRRTIVDRIKALKEVEWIQTEDLEGRGLVYILGERRQEESGIYEIFYADTKTEQHLVKIEASEEIEV